MSRKRDRFPDTRSLGKSTIAPLFRDESWKERHERRKLTNLQAQDAVREWCKENAWTFKVTNDGHHWTMVKHTTTVEWWPSSAKLVKDKRWSKGVHCHDWEKLIKYLEKVK